jgi:hypothetical protein
MSAPAYVILGNFKALGRALSDFGSFGGEIWIEIGLASEHGTSDCEEPVSNRAKGVGMTVASAPERHDRQMNWQLAAVNCPVRRMLERPVFHQSTLGRVLINRA